MARVNNYKEKIEFDSVFDTSEILRKAEPTLMELYCVLCESAHAELPLVYLFSLHGTLCLWVFLALVPVSVKQKTSIKLDHSNFVESSVRNIM